MTLPTRPGDSHQCRVAATPWAGIHAVHTCSLRAFGRHAHDTHGIGLLADGGHRSASGRGPVDAYAGDLQACNPGEVHDGRPMGSATRRWHMLHLDAASLGLLAEGVAPGLASADSLAWTRPVFRDARLRGALQALLRHLDAWRTDPRPADTLALACEASLLQVGALLMQAHTTTARSPLQAEGSRAGAMQAPDAALARVRDRLADEAALAAPSLAELAAMAGLSRFQLLRRFTQCHGLPPHAWLLQQRVQRARQLIRAGRPLGEAALEAGFADQSHMNRVFMRHYGYTPGAWQRALALQ